MGLIPTKRNLALVEKVSAAAFCRSVLLPCVDMIMIVLYIIYISCYSHRLHTTTKSVHCILQPFAQHSVITLQSLLSSTFLQTLPELVTHSLSLRSCPLILSECLGTNKTVKVTVLENAFKYEVCPPQMKKRFPSQFKRMPDTVWAVCYKVTAIWAPTKDVMMLCLLKKIKIWNRMTASVLKQDPSAKKYSKEQLFIMRQTLFPFFLSIVFIILTVQLLF